MRAASLIAAALLAAAPLAAQQETVQPRTHEVRAGETLWDIARVYLNDPLLWPEIFRLNVNLIRDPALIYPRQRLVLPGGEVLVRQAEGDRPDGVFFRREERTDTGPELRLGVTVDRPVVAEGDFYRASFVARDAEVRPVGRFTEPVFESVIDTRMAPQVNLYDRVYVRLSNAGAVGIGDRLHFLRAGRSIRRTGRVFQPTAVGTVADIQHGTATVVVVGLYDRLEPGDLAVPMARFPVAIGEAPVETRDLQARILDVQDPRPLLTRESILFLDVGRDQGVAVGDEFEAFTPPQGRDWGTRPEVRVARMQVVRVMDGTASARVTDLEQPALRVGLPVRRVARMP